MRHFPTLPLLLASFLFCSFYFCGLGELSAQNDSGFSFLEVKVLDPEGQPMPEVSVDIRIDGSEFPMPTDEKGVLAFNVPTSLETRMRLKVKHPGYAVVAANWNQGDSLPDSYTITMQKGSTIGGIIHNEEGEPIEGVQVKGYLNNNSDMEGKGKLQPMLSGVIATTDSEGRWRCEVAPSDRMDILTDFKHPDYAHENVLGYRAGNWEQLHSLKHIVVLQRGITLRGRVLDPEDQPVVGATVTLDDNRFNSDKKTTQTDINGTYLFANAKPGKTSVTVLNTDWAPETTNVVIKKDLQPVDFQLLPGRTVALRIVDQDGEPLEGVKVTPDEWRTLEVLPQSKTLSDSDGLWTWEQAPADAINYRLYKGGYMSTSLAQASARDEPYEVVVPPELVFIGSVTDAKTGQPIEKFRITEGIFWRETDDDVVWQTHRKEVGEQGHYRVAYNSGYAGFKIKVEAEGYRPQISRLVAIDEGEVPMDFALEPGSGPAGTVLQPDGQPAAGTMLIVATGQSWVRIDNGTVVQDSRLLTTRTDETGRFQLPNLAEDFSLVCLHEQGWGTSQKLQPTASNLELTLQAWAKVEGVLLQDGQGTADAEISLWYPDLERPTNGVHVQWNYRAMTDQAGRFVFPRVRPGKATVQRNKQFDLTYGRRLGAVTTHAETVQLAGGDSIQVQLGGEGRKVVGQLVAPEGYDQPVPWRSGRVTLRTLESNQQASNSSVAKQDNTAQPTRQVSFATQIGEDGSFSFAEVPAGHYRLLVTVYKSSADRNTRWEVLGQYTQPATIPAGDEGFDLGEHTLGIVGVVQQ